MDENPDHGAEADRSFRLEVMRAEQRWRTFRYLGAWFIGAGATVACIWIIRDALIKLINRPWWEPVLIALFLGPVVPAVVTWFYRQRVKRFTRHVYQRLRTLEHQQDRNRSSSGLEHDGSTPPEDQP